MGRKLKVTEMGRLTLDEFKQSEKLPLVVVLDNVRSMYNVGSVFRTSDAYRVERIVLCGITGCPPHQEIHKTALGAEDSVDWQHCDDALDAVRRLQAEGYTVLAVEQAEGSIDLRELKVKREALDVKREALGVKSEALGVKSEALGVKSEEKKYAVVLGNEVKGVQQQVVDACDGCIELPQFGTKHSLNVATTASIVIWEFFRMLYAAHPS